MSKSPRSRTQFTARMPKTNPLSKSLDKKSVQALISDKALQQ